jgi:NADPH-dependent ferric siderophore reductase
MSVKRLLSLTPHMVRVTLAGPELAGFPVPEPAASVRLLIPSAGRPELVIPEWNGNEFLLPDGQRPIIRTFTPRCYRPDDIEIDLDIVIHEGGATSTWAASASPGAPAAISGPGRGYDIDPTASAFLLAGDETAIPAIAQLLEALPEDRSIRVLIEITHAEARLALHEHPHATVEWLNLLAGEAPGTSLIATVEEAELVEGTKLWVAGEAAAMHKIRRHLFKVRGLPRSDATVRGYWKKRG